ncbi:Arc/MetJ family transcription regulator [Pararhizobium capsulatum DSM 1112]|uniref:Arc/MetJ family transcription regulator n=1 Tax=Pararhizobium capsulatum DSM 1112 TaxID=1121113 RepID=A0ABU0BN10_9HYPH|nr:type II toxin-antitoxin system VapB family antitoxin [Pararhizobium capsulatum]MDQ0319639.1 Arc/MetJ family transcription regulator [Pararhizobium capsulatum DSM 1112]
MRTTVNLDDDLMARAEEVTGIKERSALLKEALRRLIQNEAARRLFALGGSAPEIQAPSRRRWNVDGSWAGSTGGESE